MKEGIIYVAYCKCENKYYVGQTTKELSVRKREHYYHAEKYSKTYFHRALLKHHFEFSVVETIISENLFDVLNEREEYWIEFYKSSVKENGYNLQRGGRRSINSNRNEFKHSEETKDKIRKSLMGDKNPMYGKSVYDKWVDKYGIEVANIKMYEYVEKHKRSHSGDKNGMYGKNQTEETKIKISNKAKKRVGDKASRYVSIDMNKLRELKDQGLSITKISKTMNVSYYIISKRLKEIN